MSGSQRRATLRLVSEALGVAIAVSGLVALLARASWAPPSLSLPLGRSLVFAAAGLALVARRHHAPTARLLAVAAAVVGGGILADHAFGALVGAPPAATWLVIVGNGAVACAAAAAGLVLLDAPIRRSTALAQGLGWVAAWAGGVEAIGAAFAGGGSAPGYEPRGAALHVALGLAVLLARPDRAYLGALTGDGEAGRVARRYALSVSVIIGVLAVASLSTERAGFAGPAGEGLLAISMLTIAGALIAGRAREIEGDERRRRAHLARIAESEREYRLLATYATDMISRHARSGAFAYVSPACESLLGYRPRELVGRDAYDFVHPDDVPHVRESYGVLLESPEWSTVVYRFRARDGRYLWLESASRAIVGESGEADEIVAVSRDVTRRVETQRELAGARDELRRLVARLHHVRETERTELAREVHDELGQALTGIKMDLSWLARRTGGDEAAAARVAGAIALVDRTARDVRDLASRLRPALLDDLGLEAAVEWQAREFERHTGIATLVSIETDGGPMREPPAETATAAFRILQEGLTNVARHAGAARAWVTMELSERQLRLRIRDDGRGFEATTAFRSGMGLLGMRERATSLDGRFSVRSDGPETGSVLEATLPLQVSSRTASAERPGDWPPEEGGATVSAEPRGAPDPGPDS